MTISDLSSPGPRALAQSHAHALAEQADVHAVVLESVLAVLRTQRLDDRAARNMAIEIASTSLVKLRTANDEQLGSLVEPVARAFARLQNDLRPLVRFRDLDVQFVEPPSTGRALPGEVAHVARSIVRSSVLALVDDGRVHRVRIQWDCDGLNLLIGIRDDGPGELTAHDDALRPIVERISSLDGTLDVSSTAGWGSSIAITIPLDPPAEPDTLEDTVTLSARELDVMRLVASGTRNRAIAEALGISDNTVKFHVSNLLRKAGVKNRAELAGLAKRGS
jgi:DNA-binding CsgD family transcriptional regulator